MRIDAARFLTTLVRQHAHERGHFMLFRVYSHRAAPADTARDTPRLPEDDTRWNKKPFLQDSIIAMRHAVRN